MHELPKELTRSLHSWRGSVVRDSVDLERGDLDDKPNVKSVLDTTSTKQGPSAPVQQPDDEPARTSQNEPRDSVQAQDWSPTSTAQVASSAQDRTYTYGQVHRQHWGHSPVSPAHNNKNTNDMIDSRISGQPTDSPIRPKRNATFDKQTIQSNKRSVFDQARVNDIDGAASRLDDDETPLTAPEFYELMGMAPPAQGNMYPKKFAVPNGMYAKIQESYDNIAFRYHAFDIVTYILMTLQLLLSAVFIVLGSLTNVDSHIAVAALGAIGTVIAGVLALMKGQGLPNRLRQGRDSLGMVLFEAQELWWDVGAGRPILFKDIRKVREDYLRVLTDQRRNHPDNWNPTSNKIAGGNVGGSRKSGWASKLSLPMGR